MQQDELGQLRLEVVIVTDNATALLASTRLLRAEHDLLVLGSADAFQSLLAAPPDLVLIERDLEHTSALRLCGILRRNPATREVRIILFTGLTEDAFATLGLQGGADMCSGFATGGRELLLRTRRLADDAVRKRTTRLRCGRLGLDEACHRAWLDSEPLALNAMELRLLKLMMQNAGQVLSREAILAGLGDAGARPDPRKVDWYVSRVRRSLEKAGATAWIVTVRSEGYLLVADVDTPPPDQPRYL